MWHSHLLAAYLMLMLVAVNTDGMKALYNLKIVDKTSLSVKLSWENPNGNVSIKKYDLQYKLFKDNWESKIQELMFLGETTAAEISNLHPATTYNIRVVAENEIGARLNASETVTVTTLEERPSGPPTNIKVESIDQKTLNVSWKPPLRNEWNGEILGYYVGYKLSSSTEMYGYLFEFADDEEEEEDKEHYLLMTWLQTYTQYSIRIQAYNKLGAGPLSEEVRQYTAEGVPNQPPSRTICTSLTAQTIRISWEPPSSTAINGILRGYKVIYGQSDTWQDENTTDTKTTSSNEIILDSLKTYSNYTIVVLAFTSKGDGVKSLPISCQTDQDAPEPPSALKAIATTESSILISWLPPEKPNGIIKKYIVYYRETAPVEGEAIKSGKILPNQMSFEVTGLKKKAKYEFWVTASTKIGEGQQSKSAILALGTEVPAKIASFDDNVSVMYNEDVKLPCIAVGIPVPEIIWKVKGIDFQPNDRIQQLPDGSLLIKKVARDDAGAYSCFVHNSLGNDSVTHLLVVQAPPHPPRVTLVSTTIDSITVKLEPHASDIANLQGYNVHFKPQNGEWKEISKVGSKTTVYKLDDLSCGTNYQIYATAYNSNGIGENSNHLEIPTAGSKPVAPEDTQFIKAHESSATLRLNAWNDGGCPIFYFEVDLKKKNKQKWYCVSNYVKSGGNFVLLDLDPATWYNLRVTAHNNAGYTVAEFEFATLSLTGETITPAPGE